jgi:hypothetical protein
VLAPAEILARLGRQPTLLRSDDPTISDRQRSLDDTIAWSYELLSSDEQLAFRRVGAFAAGFGLEAATGRRCRRRPRPLRHPELVWSLVSKSLVASEPAAGIDSLPDARQPSARSPSDGWPDPANCPGRGLVSGRLYVDSYGPQLEKADAQLLAERAREIDNIRALIPDGSPSRRGVGAASRVHGRRQPPPWPHTARAATKDVGSSISSRLARRSGWRCSSKSSC